MDAERWKPLSSPPEPDALPVWARPDPATEKKNQKVVFWYISPENTKLMRCLTGSRPDSCERDTVEFHLESGLWKVERSSYGSC
jgi:hypothetical protein